MAADIPNNFVQFKVTSFDEFQVQNGKGLENITQKANLNFSESIAICMHNIPFHKQPYSFIRIAFIVVFLAYCMLSAWCFTWIELGTWRREYLAYRFSLDQHRNKTTLFICEKLKISNCDSEVFNEGYADYEKFILKNYNFARIEEHTIPWTFRNSLEFVLAIFFTTGDTQIAPLSDMGRILSCVLPILGIPLFLTVSLFYGKLLNQTISWAYAKLITKANLDDSTENSNQMILTILQPNTLELRCKTKTIHRDSKLDKKNEASSCMVSRLYNNKLASTKDTVSDVKQDQPPTSSTATLKSDKVKKSDVNVEPFEKPHRRRSSQETCVLPIKIAVLILYTYIAVGSIILHLQIGWDYISAFYYLQLTFTTTAIGDLDPGDELNLFHYIYVFFGFILAAMVLESIRVYLTENFRTGLEKVSEYLNFTILNDNIIMIPHARQQKQKKKTRFVFSH